MGKEQDQSNDDTADVNLPKEEGSCYRWLIVFCALYMNYVCSMHMFLLPVLLEEIREHFHQTHTHLSLLAGVRSGLLEFSGVVASHLVGRYGSRAVCIAVVTIATSSTLASAWVSNFYQLFILLGILSGVTGGCLSCPALIIVQQCFTKRRALASGIASAGFSLGSLTTGPFMRLCINHYGWRGALVIGAALNLQALVCACLLSSTKTHSSTSPTSQAGIKVPRDLDEEATPIDCSEKVHNEASKSCEICKSRCKQRCNFLCESLGFPLLKNVAFCLFLMSLLPMECGFCTYITYGISRAIDEGVDPVGAAFVSSATGCASLIGRLLSGVIGNAKWTNRNVQYGVAVSLSGIPIMASCLAGSNLELHLIFAAMFGFYFGSFDGILGTVMVDLLGVKNLAKALSMVNLLVSLAGFIILPLAGWLYDVSGGYTLPFLSMAGITILGGLIALASAYFATKQRSQQIQL